MIKVNLPQLCTGYYDLKQIANAFATQMQFAKAVKNSLLSSTELEKFGPLLDRILVAGDEQRQELLRMAQAIDTACQYYSACENRIVDQCDNSVVTYPARTTEFIRMSDVVNTLRDLGLM